MRNLIAVAALAAAILAGAAFAPTPTVAAPQPAHITLAPRPTLSQVQHLKECFGYRGVQLADLTSYDCIVQLEGDGGGLYIGRWLYTIAFYWHPATGDVTVTEFYYETCKQIAAENSSCPDGLPAGPRSNGRVITLAGNPGTSQGFCLVPAPNVYGPPPTTCTPTRGGVPAASGPRPMTAAQQASIDGFWKIASLIPGAYW